MLVWQGKAKARQTATQQPDHQKVFTFPDFLFLRAGQELVVVGMNSDQGVGDADKVTPLLVRQTSILFLPAESGHFADQGQGRVLDRFGYFRNSQ